MMFLISRLQGLHLGRLSMGVGALVLLKISSTAMAEADKASPRDVAVVQSCLSSARGKELKGERCIGVIADPCLKQAKSTADSNTCADRERLVWDSMLNEHYRRMIQGLDDDQKIKAREMQRVWMDNRDKTCAFYWDFFQGTMASPMGSYCVVRETARRAMFLKFFADETKGR
jgi:uncharacterized protein YecT (DUF1311 family)